MISQIFFYVSFTRSIWLINLTQHNLKQIIKKTKFCKKSYNVIISSIFWNFPQFSIFIWKETTFPIFGKFRFSIFLSFLSLEVLLSVEELLILFLILRYFSSAVKTNFYFGRFMSLIKAKSWLLLYFEVDNDFGLSYWFAYFASFKILFLFFYRIGEFYLLFELSKN